eukprot:TRINITY_DN987_c0_g1_i1.p1 TRINITY_DN987_c0_g1~~TRINITY_DN987_c0_g1_i1.p1  ORF type:complete len:1045 (-),score=241.02 TRINITY_DN987_c0_g1_i1:90-3140(-)
MATDTAPVISGYKRTFAIRRWLATLLGGVKFSQLSCGAYVWQPVMFLIPLAAGIVLTMLVNISLIEQWIGAVIVGGVNVLVLITMAIWSAGVRTRANRRIEPISDEGSVKVVTSDSYDEDEDTLKCCSVAGANLIAAPRVSIVSWALHVIAAFALGAGAVFMFVPYRMAVLFPSVYILFLIVGWYNFSIALYSLTVAITADFNQYRSADSAGMNALTRATFLIGVFLINFLNVYITIATLDSTNYGLHIFMMTFPLLWAFGMLPAPDVLLAWALEQMLVHIHGATHAATGFRLVMLLLFAWICTAATFLVQWYFQYSWLYIVVAAAPAALCSCNLLPMFSSPLFQVAPWTAKRVLMGILRAVLVTVVAGGAAVGMQFAYQAGNGGIAVARYVIAAGLSALWIITGLFQLMQRPLFLGYWRNRLYVRSGTASRVIGVLHRVLTYACSLGCTAYIAMQTDVLTFWSYPPMERLIEVTLLVRAFRHSWQCPRAAALSVFIAGWLSVGNVWPVWWPMNAVGMQLLIIAVGVERLTLFVHMARFAWLHFYTTMTYEKQRPALFSRVLCCIWLPVSFVSLLLSSALSAPLLPLLGLPMFIVGFPRPRWHWPPEDASSNGVDAAFYQQLMPSIQQLVSDRLETGALGDVGAGSFFFIRHQALIAWVQILERGCGYVILEVHGLEQQETSCHHAEATAVDELLDRALPDGQEGAELVSTLTPLCTAQVDTYSASKMTMTGVIDSPANLKLMPSTFIKVLLWLFAQTDGLPEAWKDVPLKASEKDALMRQVPGKWYMHVHQEDAQREQWQPDSGQEVAAQDPWINTILFCFAASETWGLLGMDSVQAGPKHVLSVFLNELPPSHATEFLQQHPQLQAMLVRAYRYAFKVVFDQAVLGDVESYTQLEEMLLDYDEHWYMGTQNATWQKHVAQGQKNMFTLTHDEGVFGSMVYTVDKHTVKVAQLNTEAVRGLWASLALELYYFTNDDDERFSIQAHKQLLRNMTIQAAAPPLGYPSFTSGPVNVPC